MTVLTDHYTSTEACRRTGLSFKQLHYWIRVGLVHPDGARQGSGHWTIWSHADMFVLLVIANMLNSGIELRAVRLYAPDLERIAATVPSDGYLIFDDGTVVHVDDPSHARDRISSGRVVGILPVEAVQP